VKIRKVLATAGLATAAAIMPAACGMDDGYSNVAYTTAPAMWGPPGICYYMYSPLECSLYGPTNSLIPVVMPPYWHARYATFYDHDRGYYQRIPVTYQSRWARDGATFERTHARDVKKEAAFGDWRDSKTGKTVSGVRPAQITKTGKPVSASGTSSKTTNKKLSASAPKKDSWGFSSSSSRKATTSTKGWGFGSSSSSSSRSGGSSTRTRP
jgi:hypothetical protein